jgi:hypothetical protein
VEKTKKRPSPDRIPDDMRPARKSTEIQPVRKIGDVALETYEQSPERPGGDERNRAATPDGPMPEKERSSPD